MSQMEGEAEELKKKLQTLQLQHNQAYELLKNLQAKESAGTPTPPHPQEKQLMVTPNEQNLSLVENMEIMNCPKRISLIMRKAQSPQEDCPDIHWGPC